ncbi:beta-ketoacyl-ACP synthase III [Pseudoflavonifractor phocaeensis]|uniref:beta-ketoacyl-ACP synthase III n=1 Tax=Pseudoflavonifractor phocaeensis TaxID=1870988 RepID=UPI001959BB87|nr:beta-ketoacyl-ACP synthase III [Pseudoflavonifractor phocaeensis]MBM6924634.1 ketoacyl-ACP synthase III [Pseudoflavonifractor phocaeensis]
MNGIKLLSTGSALPRQAVTNDDMAKRVDTSDEWIATRTGIRSRYHCSGDETHIGLCLAAARQALNRSGIGPEQIGVCIVATLSQDFLTPATACILQRDLGFPEDTVCFDLNAACSGFVYALHTAECLLAASQRKYGLIVGAEALSRITDFTDRSTCVLFGDGAGAALVEWRADYPSLHAVLGCRGNQKALYVPGANSTSPSYIHMDGKAVFRFAVEALPHCAKEVVEKAGLTLSDVDRFVFHQANQRIIDFSVKKLGVDPEKCTGNIARTGNTSAASVPLLLDELITSGVLTSGQKALCVGFGGGLTWAGALLELA